MATVEIIGGRHKGKMAELKVSDAKGTNSIVMVDGIDEWIPSKHLKVKEGSVVSGIKGFSAPFAAQLVKRGRGRPKKNPNKPYGEAAGLFENNVVMALLGDVIAEDDIGEVVRKRGNHWVLFDDETGAELGVFPNREAAWSRQRQYRHGKAVEKKAKKAARGREIRALTPTVSKPHGKKKGPALAKKPRLAPKAKVSKPKKRKKVLRTESLLKEKSMVSYVFEQSPVSDESLTWEKFVSKLSKETVMSDPKLKKILQNTAKAEVSLLAKAVDVIKNIMQATKSFDVNRKNVEKDPETKDIKMNFTVRMKDNKKTLGFAVKLENGRPLILFPEESRDAINAMANDESKLLRAELMHAQETSLDHMEDVLKVTAKRDSYLKNKEKNLDKILNNMSPLDVSMLKHLIKNKYKGIK